MSSETAVKVQKRDELGTAASRRLRDAGLVPANLYGHGEDNMNLAISADAVRSVIKHGAKVLTLQGDVSDTALLREVQWDAFGIDVLHVDLTRVSKTEKVEVTLPIELHGEAPGTAEGGQMTVAIHEIHILCSAASIPEHLVVNIGELHIGDSIHASDIAIPEGAELVTPASELVVQITKPAGASADDESEDVEQEVIAKGKADEE